jgi:replicative DNA helicase
MEFQSPPQDCEIERAVLGACMLEVEALYIAIELIDVSVFYKPAHQAIYKAMLELNDASVPVDPLSLVNILSNKGILDQVGGEATITAIAQETMSAANVRYHCMILKEKSDLRKLIIIGSALVSSAYESNCDPTELAAEVQGQLQMVAEESKVKPYIVIKEVISSAYQELVEMAEHNGLTGIDTGYDKLNYYLGGWKQNKLIVLAAKTSFGKSAFAVNCAVNVAKNGIPVAYFTLEMAARELVIRMLCSDSDVDSMKMGLNKDNTKMWGRLASSCQKFTDYPIYLDETPAISIDRLNSKARQMVKKHDIQLLFVDYLQLMTGHKAENRQLEVTTISRGLQRLSRELSIPVVALCQFNRAVDNRDGAPRLADLRESGAIEQDSDVVLFIHNPEYKDKEQYGIQGVQSQNLENIKEIIIAKNKGGPQGHFPLYFKPEYTQFYNVDYRGNN